MISSVSVDVWYDPAVTNVIMKFVEPVRPSAAAPPEASVRLVALSVIAELSVELALLAIVGKVTVAMYYSLPN
jgi:hypothetical protein